MIEFAIIATVLMAMTAGLIGAALAFYQYNAVSELARYGARWGSVIGGTCAIPSAQGGSTSDFCDQLGNVSTGFWAQPGNQPLQGPGVACPNYDDAPSDYYTVGDYTGAKATTVVASVADHFDTTSSSAGFLANVLSAGFDLRQLRACVAVSSATPSPLPGDTVSVTLHYSFTPVSGLLTNHPLTFGATSRYEVE